MNDEFFDKPKKKNWARYVFWALFVVLAGVLAFHFFLAGANELVVFAKSKLNIEKVSLEINYDKEYKRESSFDFKVVDSSGKKLAGIVLGANKTVEKRFEGMYGNALSMFRGNPSRNWYGSGSFPEEFEIAWKYPEHPMCAESIDLKGTRLWCGTGWTGQPIVFEKDGRTEIIFGAYDKNIHFVDADTGKQARKPFETEDIIKGTGTIDPDGFPLLYIGSRDNKLRIISLEEDTTKELWALDSKSLPGTWNDDWDGNPIVLEDHLITGGENGWFYVIKLNRKYNALGKVSIDPEMVFSTAAYNDNLLAKLGDNNVSIENSVTIFDNTTYFANSGGRILGIDLEQAKNGIEKIVFDFWVGDDVDATIITDDEGSLYVMVEEERLNDRAKELGQVIKLNPKKQNPVEWNIDVPTKKDGVLGGVWATPVIYKGFLYVPTNPGELLTINTDSGKVSSRDEIGIHAWSSPLISGDEMLIATCSGKFIKYNLINPSEPKRIDEFQMPGGACIESTPALWQGNIYFGSRDGFFYKIGDKRKDF